MSDKNIDLARQHLEAFCAHDWSRYRAALAPDATYEEKATQQRLQGPDAILQAVKGWAEAFPDLQMRITQSLAADDTVVLELTWEGTHQGTLRAPSGPLAPTGKHGRIDSIQVVTCKNGKIAEVHHYFDMMTLLQQLGAIPMSKAA
jgi:steroid delta-isomerase-like uncharacterized protein